MTPREQDVDRVARAMTAGGPRAGFAARVMAPILGVPQPGFTGRVMAGLEPMPRRAGGPLAVRALKPAIVIAGALAVVAVLWRPGDGGLPATPVPTLVDARLGEPAFTVPARVVRPFGTPRPGWRDSTAAAPAPEPPARASVREIERPLYRITELERPAGLAIRAIADAPPAVAPLERPLALSVPELRFEKEKP